MAQGCFKEVTEAFAYQPEKAVLVAREVNFSVQEKKNLHSLLNCSRCWEVYSMFNNLCHGKVLVSTKHSAMLHARNKEIEK